MKEIPFMHYGSTGSRHLLVFGIFISVLGMGLPSGAAAETLVLPLRSVGVSKATASVARDILSHEMQVRGVNMVSIRSIDLPSGTAGCDEQKCAETMGRAVEAGQVIYGSLSKLGEKILVRIQCIRLGEATPFYRDQLSSGSEEDLEIVMRRVAEGIVAGRSNSDLATIESVTQTEAHEPRRIATRRGLGFRGGFLYPFSDSYGDVNRMTGIHLVYKYEGPKFLVQTTSLLGLTWGHGNAEWNLLDIFGAKVFGIGNVSSYVGGGLGIKSLHVERTLPPSQSVPYPQNSSQSATTLSADVGVGILALRTYDFHLVVELRYHHVFESFDEIGGGGANGIMLTFGTSK